MQNIGLSVFPEYIHIFLGIANGSLKEGLAV